MDLTLVALSHYLMIHKAFNFQGETSLTAFVFKSKLISLIKLQVIVIEKFDLCAPAQQLREEINKIKEVCAHLSNCDPHAGIFY